MASVIPDAIRIFREAGYETISGLSPTHFFNQRDVPFTTFVKNKKMFGSPGLALQEVMFLENFRDYIAPKRVLIVGNAYGWSTVVLALIFPGAKTLAIDIDPHGVEFTNDLIKRHGLAAEAVVAESPKGVKTAVDRHLGGPVDFCLIDAMHDNASLVADFAAVHAVAAPDAPILLHDVINWHMVDGVRQIEKQHRLNSKILTRTPSGMALVYRSLAPAFDAYLNCFSDPAANFQALREFFRARFGETPAPFTPGYS